MHGILRLVRRFVAQSGVVGNVSAERARDGERGVSVTGRDAWVERDSERVSGAIGVQVRGRRIGGGGGEDFRRIARVDARDESAGEF